MGLLVALLVGIALAIQVLLTPSSNRQNTDLQDSLSRAHGDEDLTTAWSQNTDLKESLFRAVLSTIQAGRFSQGGDVQVDPRPFVADPSLTLQGIRSEALDGSPDTWQWRQKMLREVGLPEGDAVRDAPCVLAPGNGLPPPPPPDRPLPPPRPLTECNRSFSTLAIALSRSGGSHYPPSGLKPQPTTQGARTVRAVHLSTHGYVTYDLTYELVDGDEWRLSEIKELDGVFS